MSVVARVVTEAAEAGGDLTPPWVFGVATFAILGALLVLTMMIKVGR
jgi:hypothetical protein